MNPSILRPIKLRFLFLAAVSAGIALFAGCATAPATAPDRSADQPSRLAGAQDLIEKGQGPFVRDTMITPLLTELAALERENPQRIYCARTPTETLAYLLAAAADAESAVVYSYDYALAYYFSGYLFVEEGQFTAARADLEKAIELSPYNALFLNELGHVHQASRDWKQALEIFERAEEAADGFTPDELKPAELSRALRGQGFSLIELGRLDEAEALFRKCLKMDPGDERAENELRYIEQLRRKA